MLKGRRCYCNRFYPGFRCAYCRVGDIVAHEEQPDPVEQARLDRVNPKPTSLWARIAAFVSR